MNKNDYLVIAKIFRGMKPPRRPSDPYHFWQKSVRRFSRELSSYDEMLCEETFLKYCGIEGSD